MSVAASEPKELTTSVAKVKEQQVRIEDGEILGFRVDLKITFVVD